MQKILRYNWIQGLKEGKLDSSDLLEDKVGVIRVIVLIINLPHFPRLEPERSIPTVPAMALMLVTSVANLITRSISVLKSEIFLTSRLQKTD